MSKKSKAHLTRTLQQSAKDLMYPLHKYTPQQLVEEAMRQTFTHVDMNDPSVQETPARVIKFWKEYNTPHDPQTLLSRTFDNAKGSPGMVALSEIPFRALCEHHLAPFEGHAYVAYIPNKRVIGLSKIPRLVEAVGIHRPSVQETITEQLANLLFEGLQSQGSIVVVKAKHTCMGARGACVPEVVTTTSSVKGLFLHAPHIRQEFFSLVGLKGV